MSKHQPHERPSGADEVFVLSPEALRKIEQDPAAYVAEVMARKGKPARDLPKGPRNNMSAGVPFSEPDERP